MRPPYCLKLDEVTMAPKRKKGDFQSKKMIISFVVSTLLFLVIGACMIETIQDHYLSLRHQEALNLSREYAESLARSGQAKAVINRLLEDRMDAALETVALQKGRIDDQVLKDMADLVHVDEIDYYNSEGLLVHSNLEEVIGWQIYPGHPIDVFLESGKRTLIEDVRRDVITNNLYKYGYIRFEDRSLIQVGIRAELVEEFFASVEYQSFLDSILEDPDVISATIFNTDNRILASTKPALVGMRLDNDTIQTLKDHPEDAWLDSEVSQGHTYKILTPVTEDGLKIATLGVRYDLSSTDAFIGRMTMVAVGVLLLLYIFNLYIIVNLRKKNERLEDVVYYDGLTGLPNSRFLDEQLRLDSDQEKAHKRALVLVNFEQFKLVNMTLGYELGDLILQESSLRLRGLEGPSCQLFKLDADRFILYLDQDAEEGLLEQTIDKIKALFASPFHLDDTVQYMQVQMAIMRLDQAQDSTSETIKKLAITLNHLRADKECNHAFFSEEMAQMLKRRDTIERILREVIDGDPRREFSMHYQPLVACKEGKVRSFEALARLHSEELGFIAPPEFIGIAEDRHLIEALGRIILKKACHFAKRLGLASCQSRVYVNISAIQLLREDFIPMVMRAIEDAGISYEQLGLEITETTILDNFQVANDRLKDLQERGLTIALDDFGVGFSSFYRLEEMNIDVVKIDKTFIDKINTSTNKLQIAEDIISMAHKYKLLVTAEGVETLAQVDYLHEHGCDTIQGYYYSRPLSEEEALSYGIKSCL